MHGQLPVSHRQSWARKGGQIKRGANAPASWPSLLRVAVLHDVYPLLQILELDTQIVRNAVDGFNCTLFAYGQTGSAALGIVVRSGNVWSTIGDMGACKNTERPRLDCS